MTREELLKELEKLPKVETNNPISTMNSINVDDLMSAIDRLNKVPTYDELLKENQELKKQLEEKDILIKQCELSVSNVMDCYCERTDCSGRIKDSKKYDSLVQVQETQQKEFIKYLEDEINALNVVNSTPCGLSFENEITRKVYQEILQKYKGIMGGNKNESN